MFKLTYLFLLCVFAWPAYATNLEFGLGQFRTSEPPDSQYYQKTFPHSFDLISPAYYIGTSETTSHAPKWFNLGTNGVKYRIGWLDLGNVRSEAWATSDDANYSGVGGGCYDMSRCRPEDLSKWSTYSRTKGVEISIAPQWTIGDGSFFAKFGGLISRPRINIRIWRDDNDPTRKEYNYKERLNFSPTLGVGYSHRYFDYSISWYKLTAKGNGVDDPTNDVDPVNIPQNTGHKLGDSVLLLARYNFWE